MSNPPNQYPQNYFFGSPGTFPPTPPANDVPQTRKSFKNEAYSCVAGIYFVQNIPADPNPLPYSSPNIVHSPMLHPGTYPGMHTSAPAITVSSSSGWPNAYAQNFPQGSFLSPTVQDDTPDITPLNIAPFPWDWVQPHLWEKGQSAVKIGRGPNDTKVYQVYLLQVLF